MRFHRPKTTRSQVAVIPMIDILFVLLVFFIVSTAFKKPRNVLRIELPTVSEVAVDTVTEIRSVLAVDAAGKITLDSLEIPESLLESYLTAFQKQNPGRKLELEADKNISLERLLKVWDALTKVGIAIKDVPARIKANGE
jgi:biopolymer transport protein ExbD